MPPLTKKVFYWFAVIVMAIAFFLLLQAKHDRDFKSKYDPDLLTGMTPDSVRGRLGEPSLVTESGAWVYSERGGDAVIRFDAGHVVAIKRDRQ